VNASSDRPDVLVIEDDLVVRLMLAGVFIEEGHCLVTAVDFDETPQPTRFALVITDLPMRPYVATEARDWVRTLRDRYPSTPIVICTGYREACGEPDRLGADGIEPKPPDIPHLLRMAELLVAGSAQSDAVVAA
jgi:CheY-like chemotaxis protein